MEMLALWKNSNLPYFLQSFIKNPLNFQNVVIVGTASLGISAIHNMHNQKQSLRHKMANKGYKKVAYFNV